MTGCASVRPCPPPATVEDVAPEQIDAVLFLIGDTGEPLDEGEPVLEALGAELRAAVERHGGDRVRVVFLGDNIYPAGLPEEGERGYELASRRLDAQLEIFDGLERVSDRVGIFVPGNHDWDHNSRRGLDRLLRQARYVKSGSGGRAEMLPREGCPGPVSEDFGERARVIVLDTQWWIRTAEKPSGGCPAPSSDAVVRELERQLGEAGSRNTVVVGHHPFLSGGPHGQRRFRVIPQDASGGRYRGMIEAVRGAFAGRPPLLYASGHDHSLQLLRDGSLPYYAVSGAGSSEVTTDASGLETTLFCRDESGFVRLDFARDGRVRLGAFVLGGGTSRSVEVFSTFLTR